MKKYVALIGLVAISQTVAASDFLKPQEIKALLVGKKVLARLTNGSLIDFQMNADLTASTTAASGDTGNWRLSDDGYCVTWTKIRNGAETCFRVAKSLGNHWVIYPDGSRIQLTRID